MRSMANLRIGDGQHVWRTDPIHLEDRRLDPQPSSMLKIVFDVSLSFGLRHGRLELLLTEPMSCVTNGRGSETRCGVPKPYGLADEVVYPFAPSASLEVANDSLSVSSSAVLRGFEPFECWASPTCIVIGASTSSLPLPSSLSQAVLSHLLSLLFSERPPTFFVIHSTRLKMPSSDKRTSHSFQLTRHRPRCVRFAPNKHERRRPLTAVYNNQVRGVLNFWQWD